jgi:hypothetical protein
MASVHVAAPSKEEAASRYAQLSASHSGNDKLLALSGLVPFVHEVDRSFLLRCANATDYAFLNKMIRGGERRPWISIDRRIAIARGPSWR